MARIKDKPGFMGQFLAHNVNISAPNTQAKWSMLRKYLRQNSTELLKRYADNPNLSKALEISNSNNTPDELFEFVKLFGAFISSSDDQILKNDSTIFDIAEQLAEVAKLSYDSRAIETTVVIMQKLVSLK